MKTIFVCQVVPQQFVIKNRFVSQAANNFCFNFIEVLDPIKVFSFIPVFVEERISVPFGKENISAFQTRIFPHKSIGKYLNVLIDNIKVVVESLKAPADSRFWFYNLLSYHYAFSYIALKFLFRRKCYFVIADHNPQEQSLLKFLIDRSDGVISFSSGYFNASANRNKRIFPGLITERRTMESGVKDLPNIKNVLFSGRLEKYTGIDLALEVFAKCQDYNLIVSGEGALKDLVLEYSSVFKNIKYAGFLPYDQYLEMLDGVGVCLSFRNPAFMENQFNFPSKILEYMLEGKIVVSTMQYDVIEDDVILYCKFDVSSVLDTLRNLEGISEGERKKLSEKIRQTVISRFSQKAMVGVVEGMMLSSR